MTRTLARAATAFIAAITVARAADEPIKKGQPFDVPPKEWRTYYASTDVRVLWKTRVDGPFGEISGGIVRAEDGTLEVLRMSLSTLPRPRNSDVGGVGYPPLREGDLIPGPNGHVCLVGKLEVPKRGEPATFTFTTVLKSPPGTALQRGCWAVPIKQAATDYCVLLSTIKHGVWRLWVDRVIVPAKGPPTADLSLDLMTWPQLYTATVKKGDALVYAGHALRVVNVVPKNAKTRVIGWVEFDPKPLTPDEAKKAAADSGGKVVEAKAAKK